MTRAFVRVRAWVTLVAFAATFSLGFSSAGHLGPDDDAACGVEALGVGHATQQFANAQPTPRPSHCPYCHWQRAVSGASAVAATSTIAALDPIDLLTTGATRVVGSTAVSERPSRAPPSFA